MSKTATQRSNGGGDSRGVPGAANQTVPTTNPPPKPEDRADANTPPNAPPAAHNVPTPPKK